jgi:hypothetical protein
MEDELLDPNNPLSIWAYMWFTNEEAKLRKKKRKKQTAKPQPHKPT